MRYWLDDGMQVLSVTYEHEGRRIEKHDANPRIDGDWASYCLAAYEAAREFGIEQPSDLARSFEEEIGAFLDFDRRGVSLKSAVYAGVE